MQIPDLDSTVKVVGSVIQGKVMDMRTNKTDKSYECLVSFTDADNNTHERWFDVKKLELVEGSK